MSEAQVTLKILADPSGVAPGIDRAKREIEGLNAAGRTAAGGLDAMGSSGRRAGRAVAEGADQAEGALSQVSGALREQVAELTDLRNITIAATTAVVGLAAGASVVAAGYEKAIAQVGTLLSDTSGIDGLSASVRELNREFGGGAVLQAQGLADIIGAGFEDAAQSVEILRDANKLAVGGITDVKTAADGLTTTMNAYGASVGNSAAVSDAFFTSALAGKTTIEQLASSIGSVAPIAAQTGVSLNEVLAATATLTRGGVQTSTAMDGIRAAISAIIKPSSEAAGLAQELGLQFDGQALKAQGLAAFLEQVAQKTGGSAEKMAVLFGGVEALAPVLTLTGNGAQGFARDLEAMANKAGATDGALAKMTDTASFQAGRLAAAFEDSLIGAGQAINDALGPAVKGLADNFDTIELILVRGAQAALFFAGVKGLMAIPAAAGAVSTALAALIVKLGLVTPLWAYATQGMAGTTAAMLGLRSAGGAVLAMLGGWPVVVAAAAAGLAVLIVQLTSTQERAQAAAEQMRRDYAETNRRFMEARNQFRNSNLDVLSSDIAAQEALIGRMTGRFSEQSVAFKSAQAELVRLQAAYKAAGGSLESLTGTQTAARAAVDKHNASLRDQVQQMRGQIAAATGGAAAAAEFARGHIDMSQATASQRRETATLEAELKKYEGQLRAVQGATTGKTEATRQSAVADRAAGEAARLAAAGSQQLAAMIARQESAMNPAQAAAIRYRETMLEIAAAYQAVVDNGGDAATALVQMQQAQGNAVRQLLQDTQQTAQAQTDLSDASQRAAEDSARYWSGAADAISGAFGDFVASGLRDVEGFRDRVGRIAEQIVSDFVARFAEPIVLNFVASITGQGGGGGLLNTISSLFGGGGGGGGAGTGLFGSIANGVGGAVRGVLGTIFGIGGGTAAVAGGLGAIGTAGGAAGLGVAGLGGAAGGAGAFAGATAGASAGVGLMGALSSIASVAGPIALAAVAINALAGGRLFGTSYQTNRAGMQLDIGEGGASGYTFEEQSRRRALFQGTRRRTVQGELPADAQQSIDDLFASIGQTVAAAAGALGIEVPSLIASSFRRTTDAQGNVISEVGTILGRQYNESFDVFSRRIAAENVIATIDRALGGTADAMTESIGAAAEQAFEGAATTAGQYGDQLETGITTMLKGATVAVQGEASRIAERWRSDAELLADGAGLLLAAATDMRNGANLLSDGSLTQITDLIEDLAAEGEPLAEAYARVAASTQLLDDALQLSSISLDLSREQFVRFATDIVEAAGGLERAQQLWSSYYETFFTAEERAQLAAERARAAAETQFADIGRNVGDFTGTGGLQAFRAAFDEILRTGSAEAIVQWLEAAEALGVLTQATAQLGDAAITQAGTLAELMASVEAALGEGAASPGLAEQLERQRAATADQLAQATALGAGEEQLARVRALGDARITQIIVSVSQQTATLTNALRQVGVAFSGTSEQLAVAASGISGDFQQLFDEFLGSFYSDTERQALELAQAGQALAQALAAAGLASGELISREQLRMQIEAALAAGNVALAESLLRVASAMNQVEGATQQATQALINNANGQNFGGNPGGGIFDSGANAGAGGAGQQLVDEIERIRQGLRDWLTSLTTGDLSPERPRDQLRRAQAEYQRLLAAAGAGDADALRQLQGASEQVLRLGRQVFGSGAGYTQLYNQILAQVGALAGFTLPGVGPVTGGPGGGSRPGDELGDLGRSAGNAAAALDLLARRIDLPIGSLNPPENNAAVVEELRVGRAQQREDGARMRAELTALRQEMAQLKAEQARVARATEKANDLKR